MLYLVLTSQIADSVWLSVSKVFELAFFTPAHVPADLSAAERIADAALDNELLSILQNSILPAASLPGLGPVVLGLPYLTTMCQILKRAAVSGIASLGDNMPERAAHEDFARVCISTLLGCSLLSLPEGSDVGLSLVDSLAAVLTAFAREDAATASPASTREAVFTIRSAAALVSPPHIRLAVRLYPVLAKLVMCNSPEIREALSDALGLYAGLLPM